MKLRCPRCKQIITVKDEWAGKAIRCTGCNQAIQIPKPKESLKTLPGEKDLDLESLAKLEARSGGMAEEELAAAEAAVATATGSEKAGRVCPHCNKPVKVADPYVELLCSHCGKPIPALKRGSGFTTSRAVLASASKKAESKVTFFEGLGGATAYPFGALGSLLLAVGVAIGAILLPVGLMTALSRAAEQSNVGTEQGVTYEKLSGLEKMVGGLFILEVVFFIGVGLHGFIDVARASSIGEDKPPPLVWNPGSWGDTLVGYVALLGYYGLFGIIAIMIATGGALRMPHTLDEARTWLTPSLLVIVSFMTFLVPMHLLGLTVGKPSQAVNPVRIVKSIMATHINYLFLFLLVAVYMLMFGALFGVVLSWFSGEFQKMRVNTAIGNVGGVAVSLLGWGGVMGVGFYGVYVLGRVHGLFARTFRKQLEFTS